MKISVLVSGRGSNLKAILEQPGVSYKVEKVLSDKADCPALQIAKNFNVDTATGSEQELINHLKDAELVVLAGFMKLLSASFVNTLEGKMINIHPSLLPSFKGLRAQEQAFTARAKISGCTVHLVTPECDSGAPIAQAAVPVGHLKTKQEVSSAILKAEHKLLPSVIEYISTGLIKIDSGSVSIDESLKPVTVNNILFSVPCLR